jgi:hypothetical protein
MDNTVVSDYDTMWRSKHLMDFTQPAPFEAASATQESSLVALSSKMMKSGGIDDAFDEQDASKVAQSFAFYTAPPPPHPIP